LKRDKASKLKGLLWVLIACGGGILFAVGVRPLAHIVPWSWEKKFGKMLSVEDLANDHKDPKADVLLQKLVQRIYPLEPEDKDFSIEVHVVKNPVVNAYATLGGKITVNSGLLQKAESPEELAGVLAHEIEHVHRRHILEGALVHLFTAEGINMVLGGGTSVGNFAKYLLNMDFTKSQETQADEGGLKRLQIAHVSNQGFKEFFQRMEKEDSSSLFLSDHPSNQARIEMVEKFTNQDTQPILSPEEWKILKNAYGQK